MGWRVSYYKANKEQPLNFHNEAGEKYPVFDVNGTKILYDQGTDIYLELKSKEEFRKELTSLCEHPDIDVYSITKEGFKQIILGYRDRVINYTKKILELDAIPEDERGYDKYRYPTLKQEIENDLNEWLHTFRGDDGETSYFNINLGKDPNLVSGSWMYKYAIFDMLHVYKTFDWENDLMVLEGC